MSGGECERCGARSSAHARFCMACGAPLARRCPACGVAAEIAARFCVECGCSLHGGEEQGSGHAPAVSEERRTVTVLFADIVGYTTVAERLDHESVKALTDRYLSRLGLEVERFGGYVDQYIGDNVMAVFGAPIAHEDDPERAVRAAWGMQAAMAELNQTVAPDFGLALALRVGVNTGEVLAGRVGNEYTVVGDVVNVAARLQGAAAIGRILVGDRTRRSTASAVEYRQVGPLVLKGKTNPVNAWEVKATAEPREPRELNAPRAPLIGRDAELSRLVELSDQAAHERLPRLAAVIGEAGVGKTRLLFELEQRLKRRVPGMYFLRGRAMGFGSSLAFGPLAEMLRAECAITAGDGEEQIREKLLARLGPLLDGQRSPVQAEQRLAPFARLLGASTGAEAAGAGRLDRQDARDSFFGVVRNLFEALAAERLPIVIWEDAQWADDGTLELIDYLDEWVQAPLLQVCVGREELLDRPLRPASGRRMARIALQPLSPRHTRALIDTLVESGGGERAEPSELLAKRCGGNPLFAEALVDRLAEAGAESVAGLPDTVQSLLASRLDALPTAERQLLGHASVVGLTFPRASLAAAAAAAGADLDAGLALLREKNLIALSEQPSAGRDAEFAFRHMLIREVAYEMLPKAVRARKHVEVGELLEQRPESQGGVHRGALAEHLTRAATLAAEAHLPAAELARMRSHALAHCIAAGDEAAALFSNRAALARYRTAAGFAVAETPVAFEIAGKTGEVESRLGHMDNAIEAWRRCLEHHLGGGQIEQAAEMHRKIAAALVHQGQRDVAIKQLQRGINLVKGQPASLALARLFGEAAALYTEIGANMLAVYAAERALSFAQELADPRAASRAYGIYGRVFGRIGDAVKARESLDRAVEVIRDRDPKETVIALYAAARNLASCEGDYEGARRRYAEALVLAERIGEVPVQIELKSALAHLALHRCDWAEAARGADAAAELAEQEGLVTKLCLPDTLRGRLRWREGDLAGAGELLSRAREAAERLGWSEISAHASLWLGATLRDAGELDAAETILRETVVLCEGSALTPLTAEASSARVLVGVLAGRPEEAEEAARRSLQLSQIVRDPVTRAAGCEAQGLIEELEEGVAMLERAELEWERLGRPLDAARCLALRAQRLLARDEGEAQELGAAAALRLDELQVGHMASRSRELRRA